MGFSEVEICRVKASAAHGRPRTLRVARSLGDESSITAKGTEIIQKLGIFQIYLTFGKILHGKVDMSMHEILKSAPKFQVSPKQLVSREGLPLDESWRREGSEGSKTSV